MANFNSKNIKFSFLFAPMVIHSFLQALRLFLRQRPDEEFDLHQIEQVLQDCVDLIQETAEAGRTSVSATLENSITAFVACATVSTTSAPTLQGSHCTIDDEESRTTPSAFPARTACAKRQAPMFRNGDEERQEKRPVCSLPQPSTTMTRIDLQTDPRVFAVLDDGCNRTCHTPAFIDHMRAVLESEGKELSPLVGEASYTGIGGCRATGRRSIPFGLALPDGSSVRAELKLNELTIGTERIMLLSIKAQATLGLVKDTRGGRQVRVKINPTHTWVKRTQWNAHCRKTTYLRERSGQWTVREDMASLTEWQTLDPSRVERSVTVMVPTEWHVNGYAYYAMTALPSVEAENFGILTRKERKMVDSGLDQLVRHDETLWSSIRGSRPPLPSGCRAFLMILFSSMFFFWTVSA